MAYAFVQKAKSAGGTGTSIAQAYGSNVTAGSMLVAFATSDGSGSHTFSSTGDSWTTVTVFNDTGAGQFISIGFAPNATGGAKTVTCTFGAAGNFNGLIIAEFSGGATVSALDTNTAGQHNAATSTPTDASMNTTVDGDLILSVLMLDALGATVSAGSGFTLLDTDSNGMSAEWGVQATHGGIAPSFSLSAAVADGILSAALAPAAGAATSDGSPQGIPSIPPIQLPWLRWPTFLQAPDAGVSATPIALDDAGTADDSSFTVTATVPLPDTGSAADVLSTAATVPVSDAGSGSDAVAVAATIPLAEAASGADSALVGFGIALTDAGSGSDAFAVTAAVPLADTGSAADALAATATVPLADAATGSDALTAAVTVPLTDAGSGADSVAAGVPIGVTDTGSGADAATVTATVALTEARTGSDAITATVTTPLADAASGSETLTVLISLAVSDAASALDQIGVARTVTLADDGSGADSFQSQQQTSSQVNLSDGGAGRDRIHVICHRPSTGTTTRPASGTTTRPNGGITYYQ